MSNEQEMAFEAAQNSGIDAVMIILQAQADAGTLTFAIMNRLAGLNMFQPQRLDLVSWFLRLLRSLEPSQSDSSECDILCYRLIGNLLEKAGAETELQGQVLMAYFAVYREEAFSQLYNIVSYGISAYNERKRMVELLAILPDNPQSRELFSPAKFWGMDDELSKFAIGSFFRHAKLPYTGLIRYCLRRNREVVRRVIVEILRSGGVCPERLADAQEFVDPLILVEMARDFSALPKEPEGENNLAQRVTEAFEHALRLIPPTKKKGYLKAIQLALTGPSSIHDGLYVTAYGFLVEYLSRCQVAAPIVASKALRVVVASADVSLAIAALERLRMTLQAHLPAVEYRTVCQIGVRRQQILRLLLEAENSSARERILAVLPESPVWVWDVVVEALQRGLPLDTAIANFFLGLYQNSLVDRRYLVRTLYNLNARRGIETGARYIGTILTVESSVLDYFQPKRASAKRRKPKQVTGSR